MNAIQKHPNLTLSDDQKVNYLYYLNKKKNV